MRTITIEVPDEVVAILETRPLEERNQFAVAALKAGIEVLKDEDDTEALRQRDAARAAFREFIQPFGHEIGKVTLEDMRRINLYADDPHEDK
jgi:hypothetical protein